MDENELNKGSDKQVEKTPKKEKKKKSLFRKIVNVFLYIFIGLFVIILLALGFTQTSTFRNILRENVVDIVNKELNGTLSIGKIEGTIFTSLILKNVSINMKEDTLFKAGLVEVRTSPLQLLFKRIYVRKVEIRDASIRLVADSKGVWNISKLFPPSVEDTTTSSFPFTISAPDIKLVNTDFSMQNFDKVASRRLYDTLYMKDFRAKDIYVSVGVWGDIDNDSYEVNIKNISMQPNLNNFALKKFTGNLTVNRKEILVEGMNVYTSLSKFKIDASVKNFNLFDSTDNFNKADLKLTMVADKFDFRDAAVFSPSMNMFKGQIYSKLEASGSTKKLNLENITLDYLDTHLETKGVVYNLLDSDSLYIKTAFQNSHINQLDIGEFVPFLGIPVYKEYGILNLDTLTFDGSPTNFRTNLYLRTDRGVVSADVKLNAAAKPITYDLNFYTKELDLHPFAGVSSSLNTKGTIVGSGSKPEEMNSKVYIGADGSTINGNYYSALQIGANAVNRKVDFNLHVIKDTTGADLTGAISYNDKNIPEYSIKGGVRSLDLYDFVKDSAMMSNLNFDIDAQGKSFDVDSINLYMTLNIFNSTIQGKKLDSTRAIADIRSNDNGERIINLISDMADITISGDYTLAQTSDLINNEMRLISTVVREKMKDFIPQVKDTIAEISKNIVEKKDTQKKKTPQDSTTNIQYLIEFKDLSLASLFLNNQNIDIDGEMSGEFVNVGDSIFITYKANLAHIKYWGPDQIFFVANFNLDFDLHNDLSSKSVEDIYANLELNTERVFAGTDVKNIHLNLKLDHDDSNIDFSGNLENYASAKILGTFNFNDRAVNIILDTLGFVYNNINILNKEPVNIAYTKDNINFKSFVLANEAGDFSISGILSQNSNSDLMLSLRNISGASILKQLGNMRDENNIASIINMDAHITGTLDNPVAAINMTVDSITYKNKVFGNLVSKLDYNNANMNVDVRFIDSTNNKSAALEHPSFVIQGSLPIDLSSQAKELFSKTKEMNVAIKAENFNLAALGDILPTVNRLRGMFNADLKIGGLIDKPSPSGFIHLSNAGFLLETNNLEYNTALYVGINNDNISIDTFFIENIPNTKEGGSMLGYGNAKLNGMAITSSKFNISGDLKILDEVSKTSGLGAYGDLVVGTNGDVQFTIDENRMYLKAPIVIKKADVTVVPSQGSYKNSNSQFVYKYVEDTVRIGSANQDFNSLVEMSKEQKERESAEGSSTISIPFDYDINMSIEDEATFSFILSKELNQTLTAVMSGNIDYVSQNGNSNAQGEFKLLEGSTLEFIKTFSAEGSVRFENDISNPYLDITATYRDYYYPPDSSTSSKNEIEAAVKIKVKGPLKDLDKNFIKEKDNMAVYYGKDNIDNDKPDPTKDAVDALMFIATGKFQADLTQNEKSDAAGQFSSTATTIAGSLIGGVLNSYLGDYVRSVELRQVGTQTKFNLSGKVNKFKYTVGGTTSVFEDFSHANVRIEYPLIENLSMRFERKEAINEMGITNEMVNELGLKYKFEF